MKNLNGRLTMLCVFSFVVGVFLFTDMSQTAMAQSQTPQTPIKIGPGTAQPQTPQTPIKIGEKGVGGNNPIPGGRPEQTLESKVGSLMNRVTALEAENKELKQQMNRVAVLEAENKELKQQMFATKLLLSGLDKAFASHTHKLQLGAGKLALSCTTSVGNCTVKSINDGIALLHIPLGTQNPSEKMITTPPLKQ